MLHTLFQTCLQYDGINRYDEWFVTKLLVDDGRCQGVVAIELATGHIEAIMAKAVILCTGGCGKVFPFTTNANIKNGDGMALAYRAGAPLKDMEFVQYHPDRAPFYRHSDYGRRRAPKAAGYSIRMAIAICRITTWASPNPSRCCARWSWVPRSAVAGFRQGAGKGAHARRALTDRLRPSGYPPPWNKDHQQEAAICPGTVPEV